MRDQIHLIQRYLTAEFPGSAARPSPEAHKKKTATEFDYVATAFQVGGTPHTLYVSDVMLEDLTTAEIKSVLKQFNVADELRQAGKQPLLMTTRGVLLILEWIGPYPLTDKDILEHAPNAGGVYLLVEPLEAGQWKPYLIDSGEPLGSRVYVFSRQGDLGRTRGFFCAGIETGGRGNRVVRDRVVKFLAAACKIDDPSATSLPPFPVNLPRQLLV